MPKRNGALSSFVRSFFVSEKILERFTYGDMFRKDIWMKNIHFRRKRK